MEAIPKPNKCYGFTYCVLEISDTKMARHTKTGNTPLLPQCMDIERRLPQLFGEPGHQGDQPDEPFVPDEPFFWQGSIQFH